MSEMHSRGVVPDFTLGDRLGRSLKYANVSIQEMADYLEVSRNTVGNYISERTHADKPTLMLWAMRTGVDFEWLRTGRVPVAPPPPSGDREPARTTLAELTEAKRARTRGRSTGRYFAAAA